MFAQGAWDRWGSITQFHTMKGQSDILHSLYDHVDDSLRNVDPVDLSSFDTLLGVRAAIEASIKLVNFWDSRTAWNDGVEKWLSEEAFKLVDSEARSWPDID